MDKKGSAKALFCPLLHYFHKLFCFCPDTASGYRLFWFSFYRELDQFNLGVPQFCLLYALFFFFSSEKGSFSRLSEVLNSFPLVYTNILEQKRIAGQAQNIIIFILF